MIQANELRIGNWINSKLLGSNHKITGLLSDMLYTDLQLSYSEYGDWQPIPLTPEILEKCGFEVDVKSYKHLLSITINGHTIVFLTDKDYNISQDSKIKSLHQLENLYFALKGKELQVNLKTISAVGC